MKTALAAAASLLALSGCGHMPTTQPAAVATGGATYSCWQERLADNGSSLTCNWAHSVTDACDSTNFVSLPKGNLAGAPQRTHRCENGQWLVTVTSR